MRQDEVEKGEPYRSIASKTIADRAVIEANAVVIRRRFLEMVVGDFIIVVPRNVVEWYSSWLLQRRDLSIFLRKRTLGL